MVKPDKRCCLSTFETMRPDPSREQLTGGRGVVSAVGEADTIVALATPAGTSALALVRLSGPACARLAAEMIGAGERVEIDGAARVDSPTPPRPSAVQALPAARKATWFRYRDRTGAVLDEGVLTFFAGPASATGEDVLELCLHGNPLIAQLVLADLMARGCRAAAPGEFTRRAFLQRKLDLTQAEAVLDLIHARSARALAAAQRQLAGELGRELGDLIEKLLTVVARVEAYIDFPEEDLPVEDLGVVRRTAEVVLRATDRLLATQPYGDILRDGVKTVLMGAPNAGKSSLLNRLVGRERALVSPEPGTTRDFIEERILVGPHALRLIDTAGLNPSPATLERLGIAKSLEQAERADLLVLVLDAALPCPILPEAVATRLATGPALIVINKSDLVTEAGSAGRVAGPILPPELAAVPRVAVSALTGEGVDALTAALVRLADGFRPGEAAEESVAINARHADALRRCREALTGALAKLDSPTPPELMASDLRAALDALGDIVGRIDHERVLDHLFASFCIGK